LISFSFYFVLDLFYKVGIRTRNAIKKKAPAMSAPPAVTTTALEKILTFLAPLFMIGAQGDGAIATQAARDLLASYGARTNKEVRLAALTIAFSFGALDSLSRSIAAELTVNQILRLRGNANALHRAAHKSQDALDHLQQDAAGPQADADVEDLPASAETSDLVAFTRHTPQHAPMSQHASSAHPAPNAAPLSRQQRRAAERQAEKNRQRQQEAARLAERAAARGLAQRVA
jgi:hypothetical protein